MSWKVNIRLENIGLNRSEDIIKIATKNVKSCRDDDTILDVAESITTTDHRRMPVLSKNNSLIGIVTQSDILGAFLRDEEFDSEISSIMTRELITCQWHEDVEYVLQKFKLSRRGGFPVVYNNKLLGMISERDFIKRMGNLKVDNKINEIMTRKPFCLRTGISIMDSLKAMVNTHYRRMPVIGGNGKLIGLITLTDLLSYIHSNGYDKGCVDEDLDNVVRKVVYRVSEDDNVSNAISIMVKEDIGGVLVLNDKDTLVGIVTERDFLETLS